MSEPEIPTDWTPDADEVRYREVLAIDVTAPEALEALATALYDASWRVRRAASERLTGMPRAGETAERLVKVLEDRDHPGARNAAADALARIGEPSLPFVLTLLASSEADRRKFAVEILAQMGTRAGERPLIQTLADADPNVRVVAAEALGRVGGEEAAVALEAVLQGPDPLLRMSALEALAQLSRAPPLPVLIGLLKDPLVRRAAFRSLAYVDHPSAVDWVAQGLTSDVRAVRESSLVALGILRARLEPGPRAEVDQKVRLALKRSETASALLTTALEAEERAVKMGAIWAAAALKDPKLARQIAEAAGDEALLADVISALVQMGSSTGAELLAHVRELSGPSRQAASEALVQLASPALVDGLTGLLDAGEPDLELLAVRALGKAQTLEAATPLIKALTEPSLALAGARALVSLGQSFRGQVLENLKKVVRGQATPAAIFALARVGEEASLPEFKRSIRDADPSVRAATAEAVCEIGGEGSVDLVRLALADEVPEVRAAAARGLGKLGGPKAVKLLRHAISDEEPIVQAAAIDAAGDLGADELREELEALAKSEDALRAARAVRTLARLGALTPEVLKAASEHPEHEVVREALTAGAALPDGVELALKKLDSPRWDVRVAAARALEAAGTRAQLRKVREALAGESDALAREALEKAAERLARR